MTSPPTPSSTIHIHHHAHPAPILTLAPVPETSPSSTTTTTTIVPNPEAPKETTHAAATATKPTTEPPSHLSTPQLLPAPQTLIPPSALTAKAISSKTIGAASKPVIKSEGPVEVDPPLSPKDGKGAKSTPTSGSEEGKKPKTKNGYLPPGVSLNGASSKEKGKGKKGDDDDDDGDGKKKWMRYEVVESSITTTVEALEGGGTRTVWVRTDREVTVLIEPAGDDKKDKQAEKKEKEKEEAVVGGISARKERMRARMAGLR